MNFRKILASSALLLMCAVGAHAQSSSKDWSGLIGFANTNDMSNGITGGMGGEVVRVTDRASFEAGVKDDKPRVVILEGRLEGKGVDRERDIIAVGSNKTIVGAGTDATLYGIGLDIKGKSNIIIRNLTIFDANPDAIACRDAHHIWVDHCDLSSEHDNNKEDWDGLLDFTIGSSYLTASWNRFHDHDKVSVCNSGTMHFEDNGKIRLTCHHNSFMRTTQRNPRVGYGRGHVFNNYYEDISSYCIGVHTQAKVMSENNYFMADANHPFEQMYSAVKTDASFGQVADRGSFFAKPLPDNSKYKPTETDFEPSDVYDYSFALEAADVVPAVVKDFAGPQAGIEKEAVLWPGNGAVNVALGSQLKWGPLENVKETKVYVGSTPDNLIYNADASSNGSAPGVIALAPATTYYWRVVTVFADGSEHPTPLYCFTTADEKPARPYPADGETNAKLREPVAEKKPCEPMTLRWSNAFDAESYDVYLSDGTENGEETYLANVKSCCYNPGSLLYGGKYRWRVDAVKADGSVITGDTWTFTSPVVYLHEGKNEMESLVFSGCAYLEYSDGSWYTASNSHTVVGEAGPGSMTGVWNGPDANCEMSLTFWNETSGRAWMGLSVNDKSVDSWTGDKSSYKMVTHVVPHTVELRKGDQIRADFYTDGKMRCRTDYVTITVKSELTGISDVLNDLSPDAAAPVYDIMGRRVNQTIPGRIYIRNGKKFMAR